MKVTLTFVPPGGGEADYSLEFDLPGIPRPGDYICVLREDAEAPGSQDFIVRRTWWNLKAPELRTGIVSGPERRGQTTDIWVECEFARGHYSSEDHKKLCDSYDAQGKKVQKFQASAY